MGVSLVKLTSTHKNNPVYIDPQHVLYVYAPWGTTRLVFNQDMAMDVKESLEETLTLLRGEKVGQVKSS